MNDNYFKILVAVLISCVIIQTALSVYDRFG